VLKNKHFTPFIL